MDKYCIFCGKKPDNKNKEHIIPQWLIELTGNPKRPAAFGFDKNFNKPYKKRIFAFDQFVFPSCTKCNEKYSKLEEDAKDIVLKILKNADVTSDEMTILFNWMDKVRIGLWLGFIQLDKNFVGIKPKYYISSRIGKYDRLLQIKKSDYSGKRLCFSGIETYSFTLTPSVYQLIINNYYFINISYFYLFSRRMGFPYPPEISYIYTQDNYFAELTLNEGLERMLKPLIKKPIVEPYLDIYQPIIPIEILDEYKQFYQTKYVIEHCLDYKNGFGNIFKVENGTYSEYSKNMPLSLTPSFIYDDKNLWVNSVIQVLEWQNWLNKLPYNLEPLSEEIRKNFRSERLFANKINNLIINHLRK